MNNTYHSSPSLLSPTLRCKADWSKCIEHFESRWLLGCLFDSKHFYYNLWNEYLPEDAHLLCSGRLFISVTQLPSMKNKIISEFATRDELIWAIVGSMCLPFVFIRDFPVKCDAEGAGYVMDGGFSNDAPCLDSYTITVSALHKEADIQPNLKRAQKALSLSDKASSDRLGSSSSKDSNNSLSSMSAKFDEDSSDPDADSGAEDSLSAYKEEANRKHRHKIRIRSLDIIRVPKYDRVWEISGIGEECALFCRDFGRHEWTSIRKVKEMPHKSAAK
jgi:predicted acylesterase/phospholipase RssA